MIQIPLPTVFGALADPTRRAILARLAAGETSVSKLAEPFAISLPAQTTENPAGSPGAAWAVSCCASSV